MEITGSCLQREGQEVIEAKHKLPTRRRTKMRLPMPTRGGNQSSNPAGFERRAGDSC